MKISKFILLIPAIVLLSRVQSDPTGERCEECTVQDCLYGLHPDAETPGICDCRCRDCNECKNCPYGVLNLKSDGCPDCSACCQNPCDKNSCSGRRNRCVVNQYQHPFQVICPYGYKCVEQGHPIFDCKNMKCADQQTCAEGSRQKNRQAKCICPPVCAIYCEYGNVMDNNGCPTCKCKEPITKVTNSIRHNIAVIVISIIISVMAIVTMAVVTCYCIKKKKLARRSVSHEVVSDKQIQDVGTSPPPYFIHQSGEGENVKKTDWTGVPPSTPPPPYTSITS